MPANGIRRSSDPSPVDPGGVIRHPSPNHGARRGDARPELVVLHYTAMDSCAEALARLCDPAAEVSAHYLIDADGTVLQLVDEAQRAWHAGAGSWGGRDDVNSRSIGIELYNPGAHPFPEPQMAALEHLLAGVLDRHGIAPEGVIGHSDMAPGRKHDPGPRFDWRRLARRGLSVWPATPPALPAPGAAGTDAQRMARAASRFGYAPDLPDEALLGAFRLRFRPWAAGPLCPADIAAIEDLAARFAVDAAPSRT